MERQYAFHTTLRRLSIYRFPQSYLHLSVNSLDIPGYQRLLSLVLDTVVCHSSPNQGPLCSRIWQQLVSVALDIRDGHPVLDTALLLSFSSVISSYLESALERNNLIEV